MRCNEGKRRDREENKQAEALAKGPHEKNSPFKYFFLFYSRIQKYKKNLTLNSFLSGVKYFCKFLLHHARYYDCVSACFSRILRLEFVFFAYYIQFFVFLWLVKRVFDDHRRVWDYFISDPTNKFSLYVIASECHFAYK